MSRGQRGACAPDVVGEEGSRDAELAHALELVLPGRLAVLDDETVAVFSEDDLTCAFYLFAMPPEWRQYQALNKPVSGAELVAYAPSLRPRLGKLVDEPELFPAVTVIAMGWASATGLLQYLHRRLLLACGPSSGRLPGHEKTSEDMTGHERTSGTPRTWGRVRYIGCPGAGDSWLQLASTCIDGVFNVTVPLKNVRVHFRK